jgi:serine/threonine protein kinase
VARLSCSSSVSYTRHQSARRYYRHGSVAAALGTFVYAHIRELQRMRLALMVASAVERLHSSSPPIIHGDLKTANVLIEDDGKGAVVSDFGLARAVREGSYSGSAGSWSSALTISISPPEVLRNPSAPRAPSADVYAFGIVLLEMMTGQPAYTRLTGEQVRKLVFTGQRPPIPSDKVPEPVAALIRDCWAQDASQRPSMADAAQRLHAVVQAAFNAETLLTSVAMNSNFS